jgi:hypothetical protein
MKSGHHTAAVCLAVLLATPAAAQRLVYRETVNLPPAIYNPRDDFLARTTGVQVAVGPYTSIQVNVDELGLNIVGDAANEPSIAVDPTDPDNMIIGWRQFNSIQSDFRQGGYGYTLDGGQSWTFPGVLTPGTFRSDPVLDFDSQGNVYYHSLNSSFDVEVFKSLNVGQSWGPPVFAFGGDKNWMVVDRSGGTGDGNIYGIWQATFGCCGASIFNRSETSGESFEPPVPAAGSPGIGTMAVGPDGTVYAAGIDETAGPNPGKIVVAWSPNAQDPGSTPAFAVSEVPFEASLALFGAPNPGGILGQINVAVGGNGFVYVLASLALDAPGSSSVDVLFSRSQDGGISWSTPIRVNDDSALPGRHHWMAAFAVAPNGRLDAVWNDTRNFGDFTMSELFYSYSWDSGESWSTNIPVSPAFNSLLGWPQQEKIGDYYTVVSDETGANVAYSATFNSEQDVYYLRLFPDCNGNGLSDVDDIAGASFDCNSNHVPDECEGVGSCIGAGSTPESNLFSGQPLALDKAGAGFVTLSWGASCLAGDSDYEIYEGTLGAFTSHTPRVCSTAGATTFDLAPSASSSYYLVVPHNEIREGAYGRNSELVQRPQGLNPCLPQEIGACLGLPGS